MQPARSSRIPMLRRGSLDSKTTETSQGPARRVRHASGDCSPAPAPTLRRRLSVPDISVPDTQRRNSATEQRPGAAMNQAATAQPSLPSVSNQGTTANPLQPCRSIQATIANPPLPSMSIQGAITKPLPCMSNEGTIAKPPLPSVSKQRATGRPKRPSSIPVPGGCQKKRSSASSQQRPAPAMMSQGHSARARAPSSSSLPSPVADKKRRRNSAKEQSPTTRPQRPRSSIPRSVQEAQTGTGSGAVPGTRVSSPARPFPPEAMVTATLASCPHPPTPASCPHPPTPASCPHPPTPATDDAGDGGPALCPMAEETSEAAEAQHTSLMSLDESLAVSRMSWDDSRDLSSMSWHESAADDVPAAGPAPGEDSAPSPVLPTEALQGMSLVSWCQVHSHCLSPIPALPMSPTTRHSATSTPFRPSQPPLSPPHPQTSTPVKDSRCLWLAEVMDTSSLASSPAHIPSPCSPPPFRFHGARPTPFSLSPIPVPVVPEVLADERRALSPMDVTPRKARLPEGRVEGRECWAPGAPSNNSGPTDHSPRAPTHRRGRSLPTRLKTRLFLNLQQSGRCRQSRQEMRSAGPAATYKKAVWL